MRITAKLTKVSLEASTFPPLTFILYQFNARMKSLTIGRNENCDVVIQHPEVSRLHARVLAENGEWWIVDEQSTHGTFVDGHRIAKERITPASKIRLGPYSLDASTLLKPVEGTFPKPLPPDPEPDYLTVMQGAYVVYKKNKERFELQAHLLKGGVMLIPFFGPAINYLITAQVKKRVIQSGFFREFKTKARCPHCDYGIYQLADRPDTVWEEFVKKAACPNCRKSLTPKNN